jgi:hypothetical protein
VHLIPTDAWQVCINGGPKNPTGFAIKWYFSDPAYKGPYGTPFRRPVRFTFWQNSRVNPKVNYTKISLEVNDFQVYTSLPSTQFQVEQITYQIALIQFD